MFRCAPERTRRVGGHGHRNDTQPGKKCGGGNMEKLRQSATKHSTKIPRDPEHTTFAHPQEADLINHKPASFEQLFPRPRSRGASRNARLYLPPRRTQWSGCQPWEHHMQAWILVSSTSRDSLSQPRYREEVFVGWERFDRAPLAFHNTCLGTPSRHGQDTK